MKSKKVNLVVLSDSSLPLPEVLSVSVIYGVFPICVPKMAVDCFC